MKLVNRWMKNIFEWCDATLIIRSFIFIFYIWARGHLHFLTFGESLISIRKRALSFCNKILRSLKMIRELSLRTLMWIMAILIL